MLQTTAKLLVPVRRGDEQMPMIGIALARLSALGYRNVSLLTSRDPEAAGAAIEAYAASAFGGQLALTVYRERYPLGTAGAVYAALRHIRSESIAVVPGDTLFPFETLSDALAAHDWESYQATWLVTTRPGARAQNEGALIVDPSTHCIAFALEGLNIMPPREVTAGLISATSTGALIFNRAFFLAEFEKYMSRLDSPVATDLYREFVPWLISSGHETAAFDIQAAAPDLGTPERFQVFSGGEVCTGSDNIGFVTEISTSASAGAGLPFLGFACSIPKREDRNSYTECGLLARGGS
jgi:NDP-sugar pyrophosphorylase family protein